MNIGVLCVQGAFLEHEKMLEKLGADYTELRKKTDIKNLDGIILPGGESTVQGKLLRELDMFDEIKELISKLKKTNPDIEKSIFNSIHNVCLDTFPGYKSDGTEHSFLERYERNN